MLAALHRDAGIEADTPNPCGYITTMLKTIEAMPQLDKHLLEEVISLISTLGEHEAHGVDCATMFANDIRKFLFFFCHCL
jgi:hypothetical protein